MKRTSTAALKKSPSAVKVKPEIEFMVHSELMAEAERWSFTREDLTLFIEKRSYEGGCSPSLIRLVCLLEHVHEVTPEILPEVRRIVLTFR
jgi:hypothetical protein